MSKNAALLQIIMTKNITFVQLAWLYCQKHISQVIQNNFGDIL